MGNFAPRNKAIKIAKAVTLCKIGTFYEQVALKLLASEILALYFKSHYQTIVK